MKKQPADTTFFANLFSALFSTKPVRFNFASAATAFFLLLMAGGGVTVISGQTTTQTSEHGFTPGNSYSISNIETISQRSGNLMLNVPLAALPAGRGGMSGGLSLNYNSKIWDVEIPEALPPDYRQYETLIPSENGGWNYAYEYKLGFKGGCDTTITMQLTMPDGGTHLLWLEGATNALGGVSAVPDGVVNCWSSPYGPTHQTSTLNYFTIDGSFLRVEVEGDGDGKEATNRWTVYLPDGSRVVHNPNQQDGFVSGQLLLQRQIDRNGNFIDVMLKSADPAYSGRPTTTFADQFGRKIILESVYVTASSVTTHTRDYIHAKGFNGADLVTTVDWKEIRVQRNYKHCPLCTPSYVNFTTGQNFTVVDKITLPAAAGGLAYEFGYNADLTSNPSAGWGEVSRVTLPSGAYSTYEYEYHSNTAPRTYEVLGSYPKTKTLNYREKYDGVTSDLITETWSYSGTNFGMNTPQSGSYTTTAPDGSSSTEYYRGWDGGAYPYSSKYIEGYFKPYKSVSGTGVVVERLYANNVPADTGQLEVANQFVKYELTTLPTSSGGLSSKTAVKEFFQDKNGNTYKVKEYGFVPVSRDGSGNLTGLPSNLDDYLKRITKTEFYNPAPDSASSNYTDGNRYQAGSYLLRGLAKSIEVQNAAEVVQSRQEMDYDYTAYTTNTKAGNLTAGRAWDSTKGAVGNPLTTSGTTPNAIATSAVYDAYGSAIETTDANGTVTQITYGTVTVGSATVTGPYPTQTIAAAGTALARSTTAVYDFSTGLVTASTDVDNGISSTTDYDPLGRPVKTATAVGTALESWTQTAYDDLNRRVVVGADLFVKGDAKKVATQFYDQLGRVRLSKALEDAATQSATNETDGIKVQTRYLTTTGYSYQLTSNPYRANYSSNATGEPEMGWTRSASSSTGRHAETETFSGAGLPAPWGSNSASTGIVKTDTDADRTLVTDQAGKQRISRTNGLGQLTDIWEVKASDAATVSVTFPGQSLATGYQTSYVYDTLNNLMTVNQGSQTRSFTYSSLSRLTTATNPEAGTISYVYDAGGNLTGKTDARTITTTYAYDALNRVTGRSYSDATPAVAYTYDNLTNAKGKLTKVSSSNSTTEYTSFDILGRVTGHKQSTGGNDYTTAYTYNLSGALLEETYPNGRVVRNTLDSNGDLAQVSSKKDANFGFTNYAGAFTYTAAGAVSSMRLGSGKWESTTFNSRLQPTQIALGGVQNAADLLKLNYSYGTTANNGNVITQKNTVQAMGAQPGFTATQTYTYDELNRLSTAEETNDVTSAQMWKQAFTFDRYGNRNFDEANTTATTSFPKNCGTAPSLTVCTADRKVSNPSVNASNNRLSSSDGYTFDTAGNTTVDAQGRTFVYDAENKQISVSNSSATLGQYVYDGDGKRVKKLSAAEETIFVYDAAGKEIAEYSTALNPTPQVSYLTSDNLGTPRINTDQKGDVISRHDYQPYGEEIATPERNAGLKYQDDAVRKQFTGYERDQETDLDYAQARMYSNRLGRFTSIDIGPFVPAEPKNWNRYNYVENNPLKYKDSTGKELEINGEYSDELLQELEAKTGFKLKIEKGLIKIDESVKRQKKGTSKILANLLKDVIGSHGKLTLTTIYEGSPGLLLDNGKTKKTFSMEEYRAFNAADKNFGAAALGHVLKEGLEFIKQDEAGVFGGNGPHEQATITESNILSELTHRDQGIRSERVPMEQRDTGIPGQYHAYRDQPAGFVFVYKTVEYLIYQKSDTQQADKTQVLKIIKNK